MMEKFFIISAVILQITFANKLPDYIHRCKISDPQFDDCVRDSANKALWPVLEGDKTFGFPQLLPFTLPNFNFDLSENVNFKLTNGMADVSKDVAYPDIRFDFDKKTVFLSLKTSRVTWYVDYESSGKLTGKPFHEMGKANATFGDTITTSNFEFRPYNQVSPDEPMTAEQLTEYEPYLKKIGLAIRKEAKKLTTDFTISELNIAFRAQPFDEIFLP